MDRHLSEFEIDLDLNNDIEEVYPPVTVCVAALCLFDGHYRIVGASDRRLTVGNMAYDPERYKSYSLTGSIGIMTAGEAPISYEILDDIYQTIKEQDNTDLSTSILVKNVAQMFCDGYNKLRQREVENEFLARLKLTFTEFWAMYSQNSTNKGLEQMMTKIVQYPFPDVSFLVCGSDKTGMHIYQVANASMKCRDSIGYASIGAGATHANSHFAVELHTADKPLTETLFRTFSAKMRAQANTSVGPDTDMFVIYSHNFGQEVDKKLVMEMGKDYKRRESARKRSQNIFFKKLKQYEDENLEQLNLQQQSIRQKEIEGSDDASHGK